MARPDGRSGIGEVYGKSDLHGFISGAVAVNYAAKGSRRDDLRMGVASQNVCVGRRPRGGFAPGDY